MARSHATGGWDLCRMKWFGSITSHVLLAFKHDEGIAPVGFALLVSLFIRVGVPDDANLAGVSQQNR